MLGRQVSLTISHQQVARNRKTQQKLAIMMAGPVMMAVLWTVRPAFSFVAPKIKSQRNLLRFFASTTVSVENNVSRLQTLQTLLSKHGAPGSQGCKKADDLVPVELSGTAEEQSELIASMSGDGELDNLHPYLFPIAKSTASGNYVCAYRNPFVEESDKDHPWPIVEAKIGGPGMKLLALNSEHLMRRIACEGDAAGISDLVDIYNDGLGNGNLQSLLDAPYEAGSVDKLGYGTDKYVLLRVGPFADLYQSMSLQHQERGDEQSSLIAAEAANGKLSGFGSNFLFYAKLLSTYPNREEESRDAARMCLRLPLTTAGMTKEDFKEIAVLGQIADKDDSMPVVFEKLKDMYEKVREAEKEEDGSKTPEQAAIDDAAVLIDKTALSGKNWSTVRNELAGIFRAIGREDVAKFVDL